MKSADPYRYFASAVPCDRVHDLEKRRFRNCVIFYKGDSVASLNNEWNAGIFCKAGLRVDRPDGLQFAAAYSVWPQLEQNLLPGMSGAPQPGQVLFSLVPHMLQKFDPAGSLAAHCGHVSISWTGVGIGETPGIGACVCGAACISGCGGVCAPDEKGAPAPMFCAAGCSMQPIT